MIIAGSPFAIEIKAEQANAWPSGATFRGGVKSSVDGASLLAELSSAGGHVERIDGQTLIVTMPGAMTALFSAPQIVFDLWRTDLPEPAHWGVFIQCAVAKPVSPKPAP